MRPRYWVIVECSDSGMVGGREPLGEMIRLRVSSLLDITVDDQDPDVTAGKAAQNGFETRYICSAFSGLSYVWEGQMEAAVRKYLHEKMLKIIKWPDDIDIEPKLYIRNKDL